MTDNFVNALYRIADKSDIDRAPIAIIKRGASDPTNNYLAVSRYLGYLIPGNSNHSHYFTLATLFSLYPTTSDEAKENKAVSLGVILRRVKTGLGEDGSKSFELKVNRLLNCDADDLPRLLAVMFRYLKGQDVGRIDYDILFEDIRNWDAPNEFVQKRLAKEFWAYQADNSNNTDKKEDK